TLQGNLDPSTLYGPHATIRERTRQMLTRFAAHDGQGQGHIANLGHGMYPDHDPEALREYMASVHDISTELRGRPQ
ncbi:Uroporphyrinogen decarboxylase in heme biosynthesis, partial [Tieghemiomyces parasiticus]